MATSSFTNISLNTTNVSAITFNPTKVDSRNSMQMSAGSAYSATGIVSAGTFLMLNSNDVKTLTSSVEFNNNSVYWGVMSSVGWNSSSKLLTDKQYNFLSNLYLASSAGYLSGVYNNVVSNFTPINKKLAGYDWTMPKPEIIGVSYNYLTSGTGSFVDVKIPNGGSINIGTEYNNKDIGILFEDYKTKIYTVSSSILVDTGIAYNESIYNVVESNQMSYQYGGMVYFGGTDSDFLSASVPAGKSVANLSAFTIDFWVNYDASDMYANRYVSLFTTDSTRIKIYKNKGIGYGGANPNIIGGILANTTEANNKTQLSANNWYHVAYVNNGNSQKVYVNGTYLSGATTAYGTQVAETKWCIGKDLAGGTSAGQGFKGYIKGFRISNSALYTSNFTPNFNTLPSTEGAVFLMRGFNNTVIDATNTVTVVKNGNVTVS